MRASSDPIRADLFSAEHLEQFAATLAAEQNVRPGRKRGTAAAAPAARERPGAPPVAAGARGGQPRDPHRLSRRGVAAQQLPHRRGADSRDPRGPPAGLLPRAAQARDRDARRLPARLRPRLGLRRAHRQPLRSRDAAPLRPRLPARAAAHDRRALGPGDLAARRARREPPAPGRADRCAEASPASRPTRSPTRCSARTAHPKPGPAAVLQMLEQAPFSAGLRGPARPEAARAGPGGHARARVARRAARARGDDGRGGRPRRAPGAGRRRTRRCATSSPACACCRRPTGRTSSRA